MKGKTDSGFDFDVEKEVFDDMELLDALVEADSGSLMAVSKVAQKVLGTEQKKRLYDHLRQENGRVPVQMVSDEIANIMKLLGEEGKN